MGTVRLVRIELDDIFVSLTVSASGTVRSVRNEMLVLVSSTVSSGTVVRFSRSDWDCRSWTGAREAAMRLDRIELVSGSRATGNGDSGTVLLPRSEFVRRSLNGDMGTLRPPNRNDRDLPCRF